MCIYIYICIHTYIYTCETSAEVVGMSGLDAMGRASAQQEATSVNIPL